MPQLSGRRHSKASSHVEEDDDPFETPYEVPNENNHHSTSKTTHNAKTNTTKKSSEKLEKQRSSETKSRRSSESSRKHSHDSTSHNTPVRQKSYEKNTANETQQNALKRSENHEKRDKSTEKSSSIQRTNSAHKSGSIQNNNSLQRTPSSTENNKNSSKNSNDSPTTPPPIKKSSFATAFEEAINSQTGSVNSRKVNSTRNLPKGAVIKDKTTPKVVKRPPKSPENQSYGQSAPKMAKTLSFDEAPPTSKRRPSGSSFIHDMPVKSPLVRKEVARNSPQVVQRSFSNSKAASIADKRHNTRKNVREALYDRLTKDNNTDRDTELSKN